LADISEDMRISSLADVLDIQCGDLRRNILIHAFRGLQISGRVIDPYGVDVAGASVDAMCSGIGLGLAADVKGGGVFTLGPLAPGIYRLHARSPSGMSSQYVTASCGEKGVVLTLGKPGGLRGIVVAADGPVKDRADLIVSQHSGESGVLRCVSTAGDGSFEIDDLEQGVYDVVVRAKAAGVGVARDIEVQSGSQRSGVIIRLQPSALLRVSCPGARDAAIVMVREDGVLVANSMIEPGGIAELDVPPGRLVVRAQGGDGSWQQRLVEVKCGSSSMLSIDGVR
jgi:hypothetical protein